MPSNTAVGWGVGGSWGQLTYTVIFFKTILSHQIRWSLQSWKLPRRSLHSGDRKHELTKVGNALFFLIW